MFRRRPPSASDPATGSNAALAAGGQGARTGSGDRGHRSGPLADLLAAEGWALPKGLAGAGSPRWSLVGTVASPTATPVDPAGLVVADGWSLDWWIGADDRWHMASQAAAVRQDLYEDAPIVETRMRIPGGDAVHRAYGIRSQRSVGDEWVVVEITNDTPIPFAVALVVRPLQADAVGAASVVTVEPTEGGAGRDVAHLVRVDGRPGLVLPRRPARFAAGSRAEGDVVTPVTSGAAVDEAVEARCDQGLATLAMIFPLPHTATLRVLVPVGETGEPGEAVRWPAVVPDVVTVASGWEAHSRGPRLDVPDQRLARSLRRSRAALALAGDGEVVRRDGHRSPDLDPGATERILAALDVLDRPDEVSSVIARWPQRLSSPSAAVDAVVLGSVARHWLLHRRDGIVDGLLPEVAAAVERIDRADRKGRLDSVDDRERARAALVAAAAMFEGVDQPQAAVAVAELAGRLATPPDRRFHPDAASRISAAAIALARGDAAGWSMLETELGEASPTGAWAGPGPDGRPIGADLAAAAALVLAARTLLVVEGRDGLALVPVLPDGWYGGGIELHDAPTSWGTLSFAVRWHGTRPALLWDLVPHGGPPDPAGDAPLPARLTAPGLDPTWSSSEWRGEALLAEVAPPEGLDLVTLVADHPDIDPAMRRPGAEPDGPAGPIPEGGSFS